MSVNSLSWEHHLQMRATHALDNRTTVPPLLIDKSILEKAYLSCQEITRQHSKTFFLASRLLPFEQRRAVHALYAFCRISDDLIDEGGEDRLQRLISWKHESLSDSPNSNQEVALAWADARAKFYIPKQYAEQLLDGVALDLTKNRFTNFKDLANYCYGVASTVGLMTMHIVDFSGEEAIPYAIKLGVALQLTNILRDVGEDWQNGRLYLPQDEMAQFGITEAAIHAGLLDDRWQDFMQFQIQRTRQLYAEAMPGIRMLGKNGRFAIAAAAELYQGILDDIEANHYDVFNRRAYLNGRQKLSRLPGIWLRSRYH